MPHHRYYLAHALESRESVSLQGDEWHHLVHVLRGNIGDRVELINGTGKLVVACIEELKKKEALLRIEQCLQDAPPPPRLILALALSRMHHLEWAVEKATELGASELWLFPGILSEKATLSDQQKTRIQALILAATKQCGRLHLPQVCYLPPLTQWKALEGTLFLCDTAPSAPYLWDVPLEKPFPRPIVFFIGPEKGFDPKEVCFLKTTLKAQGVRLHPHILRTETAPLVALSLIQQF